MKKGDFKILIILILVLLGFFIIVVYIFGKKIFGLF